MKKYISFQKNKMNQLELVILEIDNWDGFDKLIKYLEVNFNCNVLDIFDGPGARKAVISCENVIIELVFDDGYGNYIIAKSDDANQVLMKIGEDLDKRFKLNAEN